MGQTEQELENCNDAFVQAGYVKDLFIYPIKSFKGNKVDWLDCGKHGSTHGDEQDRHFLIIDSMRDNLFITARLYPRMILVEVHAHENLLTVNFPAIDDKPAKQVHVNLCDVRERNDIRRARMFKDKRADGLDCGDEIAAALDEFFGVKYIRALRLIWFADEQMYTERNQFSEADAWLNNPVPEVHDEIFYSDNASFMAFSQASIDDLNEHLTAKAHQQISIRNFRPNIVVAGVPAFDEDRWLRLRIGEAEFVCYKPCTRCLLTTIEPEQGVKNVKMEPLRELRNYRLAPGRLLDKYEQSPVFGVYMSIVKPGRVQVADQVWIQYKPSPF